MAAGKRNNSFWMFIMEILLLCLSLCVVVLHAEPVFNTETVEVEAHLGGPAVLPCDIQNKGDTKVAWVSPSDNLLMYGTEEYTLDDRFSIADNNGHQWHLAIENVSLSDSGEYKCQLIVSPIQVKRVRLFVMAPVMINDLTSTEVEKAVQEGETVTLVCDATGYPPPQVTWYRRSSMFNGEPDGNIDAVNCVNGGEGGEPPRGQGLVVYNVSRSCSGIYECVASNGFGKPVSRRITLQVHYAPQVSVDYPSLSQYSGLDIMLDCFIKGYPLHFQKWTFKSMELDQSNKYKIETFREETDEVFLSMRITNVQPEDFGVYTCFAGNNIGNSTATITLTEMTTTTEPTTTTTEMTTQPPTMAQATDQVQVSSETVINTRNGLDVVLPCTMDTEDGKYKVMWVGLDKKLISVNRRRMHIDDRYSVLDHYQNEWNLRIQSVTQYDGGVYTCKLSTKPPTTRIITLNVDVPPRINLDTSSSANMVVVAGESVSLICDASGYPEPNISWTFLMGKKSKPQLKSTNSVLPINQATTVDDGMYECRASNGISPEVSHQVSLEVQFPPTVMVENNNVCQARGRKIILGCKVTANPAGTVIWKFGGIKLKNNYKYSIKSQKESENVFLSTLRLQSIDVEDFGMYTCLGNNRHGESTDTAILYECPITSTKAPKTKKPKKTDSPRDTEEYTIEPEHEPVEPNKSSSSDTDGAPAQYHSSWLILACVLIHVWANAASSQS